jgi:glycerophosphoryl diester phosphodiesterase
MRRARLRIFHVSWPTYKHVENSLRGIRRAARRGFTAIDLDLQITRDGVIVVTHWDRPLLRDAFFDPLKRLDKHARVSELTWRQVRRLRTLGGYRIVTLERALRECRKRRIEALIEPKGDPRWLDLDIWHSVAALARVSGARVEVRTLRDLGGRGAGFKRAQLAREVGFNAWTIAA